MPIEDLLEGRWIDLDARHNFPRLGRILMATGRDAADVAITTSFVAANLVKFYVESNEVDADGNKIPLPITPPTTGSVTAQSETVTPTQTNPRMSSPAQTNLRPPDLFRIYDFDVLFNLEVDL
jgi:hypothetical protein